MASQMEGSPNRSAQNRKRWTLVALMALFLLPVVAAWLWTPSSFRNRGDLVSPPRPLPQLSVLLPDGNRAALDSNFGRWTYFVFIPGPCEDACRQLASTVERVRMSQGKNGKRIQLLMLSLTPSELDSLSALSREAPDIRVLGLDREQQEALLGVFGAGAGSTAPDSSRIYLVDPMGNLMMSYPTDSDAKDLRKDIGRLLRASRIG